MSPVVDLTLHIQSGSQVYEGDPEPIFSRVRTIAHDGYRLTHISMGGHTGTHIDAPAHYIENGTMTDEIKIEVLIGKCCLLDVSGIPGSRIKLSMLKKHTTLIRKSERVVFRSNWSKRWGTSEYYNNSPSLTIESARWLADYRQRIKLVGFDMPTPATENESEVHRILLQAGIPIVEGLDLNGVTNSEFNIIVAPLAIKGCDGVPCRVFGLFK